MKFSRELFLKLVILYCEFVAIGLKRIDVVAVCIMAILATMGRQDG